MPLNPHFEADEQEYLDEREAIAQYDGGLSEDEARYLAYACYVHKFNPACKRWYPLPE